MLSTGSLGQSYYGLGLYPKVEEAHSKAKAVREASLGTDPIDTLATHNHLAGGRNNRDDPAR